MSPSMDSPMLLLTNPSLGNDSQVNGGTVDDVNDCGNDVHYLSDDSIDRCITKESGLDCPSLRNAVNGLDDDMPLHPFLDRVCDVINKPSHGNPQTGGKQGSRVPTANQTRSEPTLLLDSMTKKRKKPSANTSAYTNTLASVGEQTQRLYTLMEGEFESSSRSANLYSFQQCMDLLVQMSNDANLDFADDYVMFCFACSKLSNKASREVFICIPDNSLRLAWLKYEFDARSK